MREGCVCAGALLFIQAIVKGAPENFLRGGGRGRTCMHPYTYREYVKCVARTSLSTFVKLGK